MIYLDNAAVDGARRPRCWTRCGRRPPSCTPTPPRRTRGARRRRARWPRRAPRWRRRWTSSPAELVFTSGGTEADALGVLGAARAARGRHLVVSALEHPAVMRCAEALAGEGCGARRRRRPTPTASSAPTPSPPRCAPDTAVVALMLVNNELGTLQPVADVARRLGPPGRPQAPPSARRRRAGVRPRAPAPARAGRRQRRRLRAQAARPAGRGRAVAAPGRAAGAALGRRRAGARPARRHREPARRWSGSASPRRWRATPCRPAPRSGSPPCAIASSRRRSARWRAVVPGARPTVTGAPRAPHIASLAFPGLPAEPLLHALEARGVLASAGSACASRTAGPSPTLKAIGVDDRTAVLRFSFSRLTTAADCRRRGRRPRRRGARAEHRAPRWSRPAAPRR